MSSTEFQPTLPPEGGLTDAEFDFMEQEPGGLFPQNQDSNFGYIVRKMWTDRAQEIADEQTLMYNEKFPETSTQFLDVHEQQYGLPINPSTLTLAQRRSAVLNRIRVGPFTNARRRAIVESYISATFGTAVQLLPPGVPVTSGGIQLYGEPGDVSTLYAIRENGPGGKNLIANSNFEANVSNWSFGYATVGWYPPNNPMYGARAADVTATGGQGFWFTADPVPVIAGKPYSVSGWLQYLPSSPGNRIVNLQVGWTNASSANLGQVNSPGNFTIPKSATQWTRVKFENLIPPAGATLASFAFLFVGAGVANDEFFVDGVQFEQSAFATDYADPSTTPFFYEVRIKNTVTPDLVGLNRELTRITPAGITYAINFVTTP